MRNRSRLIPLALAAGLIGGATAAATAAPSDTASAKGDYTAQSCYGSARPYTTNPYGIVSYWPGPFSYARATTNCADINVKSSVNRRVKVCWSSGVCQNRTTLARAGQWTVIATNVRDGASYHLVFDDTYTSTGKVAA
ncbi:hypothetical protein [Streptomyces venezuelae]|uniref:hypothetical protein n=1 Tax=Streptomyces venezuelae TaxID=54571 RepID=UPI00364BE4E8